MSTLLTILTLLWPSPAAVEALRASAPRDLTTETAREHLTAAQAAAVMFQLDPSLLLAIAYRESRYTGSVRGPEVQGKHACGVMQPLMGAEPCPAQDLLAGYTEGARHLRVWLDTKTCRLDIRCALLGYAGGYRLLKACAAGQVLVERAGRTVDLCTIPDVTLARARRVRGEQMPARKPAA